MLLNLLNLFSLIIALFKKIYLMNEELERLRQCPSNEMSMMNTTIFPYRTTTDDSSIYSETTTDDSSFYSEAATFYSIFQTAASELFTNFLPEMTTSTILTQTITQCHLILVNCSKLSKNVTTKMVTSLLLVNFTSTIFPEIMLQSSTTTADVFNTTMYPTSEFDVFNTTDWYDRNITTNINFMRSTANNFENATDGAVIELSTSLNDDYSYYDDNPDLRRKRYVISFEESESDSDYPSHEDKSDYYPEYKEDSELTTENEKKSNDVIYMESNSLDDVNNITQFISTTVASFLENTTFTSAVDLLNESYVSEKWNEYLTTTDFFNDTFETISTTTDDYIEADEDEKCYETVCDNDSTTASNQRNDAPMEMRISEATTFPSITSTQILLESNESLSKAVAALPKQKCVPFLRNRADNITGIPPEYVGKELSRTINKMNEKDQMELRDLCWETLFGQELVKLTVLDLIFTIFTTFFMDFFRALFVRFMNKCWCWDLEKKWPKVMNLLGIGEFEAFFYQL